jgi:hypothetical protein
MKRVQLTGLPLLLVADIAAFFNFRHTPEITCTAAEPNPIAAQRHE